MVEDGKLYDVLWTPDFTEDLFNAVAYISEELGSPMAAHLEHRGQFYVFLLSILPRDCWAAPASSLPNQRGFPFLYLPQRLFA